MSRPSKSEKIEDGGEYLPYAKKHLAVPTGPRLQENITLKQLWPEPNWLDLAEQGKELDLLANLYVIYSNLAHKPRKSSFNVSDIRWEIAYIEGIKHLSKLFESAVSMNDFEKMNERYIFLLNISKEDVKSVAKSAAYWALGRGNARRAKSPFAYTHRMGALSKYLSKLGWPYSEDCIKYGKFPVLLTNGQWVAADISGKTFTWETEYFSSEEDVLEKIKSNMVISKTEVKERKSAKSMANLADRKGEDIREGVDITNETLMQAYGLRAIQFGNSLSQTERQESINHAYEAFNDLAYITGMQYRWIGLGKLALAIGARGNSGAAAHFEPDLWAINITRMRGAGSLAHEWCHALDHRLILRLLGRNSYYQFLSCYIPPDEQKPDKDIKILSIYRSIMDAIKGVNGARSNYLKQAYRIESRKGEKKYWSNPEELFARACEAAIQDMLAHAGRSSPWLVHGTLASDYTNSESCPYPIGGEREVLCGLFKNLFDALISN